MSRLTITCVITQILVSQHQYSCQTTEKNLNFMLKAQIALATGHFFNQLGHVGVVTLHPQNHKQRCASEDVDNWHICFKKLLAEQTFEAFEVEYVLKLVKS